MPKISPMRAHVAIRSFPRKRESSSAGSPLSRGRADLLSDASRTKRTLCLVGRRRRNVAVVLGGLDVELLRGGVGAAAGLGAFGKRRHLQDFEILVADVLEPVARIARR